MKLNVKETQPFTRTFEGAKVKQIAPEKQLKRLVLANMLWEDQFYIDGASTADLIKETVNKIKSATFVANLAAEARNEYKLRHVPLLLLRELARVGKLRAEWLTGTIQRPDEMAEFLALYWKEGKQALSNQVKKGLAAAFSKFNEYQLAKWDKNSARIKLRDVMFLCHPKPNDFAQERLFWKVASNTLETPDTWETQLSAGANKAETFTRLMSEKKLGALAFLRNLRNMVQSGVYEDLIREYAKTLDVSKVLPFRYIAAAKIVPHFEDMLEDMMLRSLLSVENLPGNTLLLVDVSGSMFGATVSSKSDLDRFDAAAALAMLCREVCESVEVFTFSDELKRVAPRRGFALREAMYNSQRHVGTDLRGALEGLLDNAKGKYDRIIVFTDEQSRSTVDARFNALADKRYILNVASYQNGINNGNWHTITGFSEASIDYIREIEKSE